MATKKKVAKKTAKKAPVKPSQTASNKSKVQIATEIFNRMYGKKDVSRKDIILEFMKKAKLSQAGAQTYYQNLKKKL